MKSNIIQDYLDEVSEQFYSGHAVEHAYRPALKRLFASSEDTLAVNDPKHSEHGAPDFVFLKKSNQKIIKGHAEAKDITVSLDKTEKTEQMQRYHGYANLILTDYLEFRFFRNGEKYETISLGSIKDKKLYRTPENGARLLAEIDAFLEQPPESIRSGKRLAQIMGGKARRIRDNVIEYLKHDDIDSQEFDRIYEMMKKMLVHDLTPEKFADMYAQTLVYGLFVARYGDDTPDNFTRSEARDLVPKSNPFLQHFFDHIVGPNFDSRLAHIVDELCEIFSVSNVQEIVHKHLKIADETTDAKDPIIHFYEDFLQEYDSKERKKMGAYYTPIPVVKYIVRQVDRILREDFGISKGLASSDMITRTVDTQPWRKKGERKDRLTKEIALPRVQILDPAVGTATFLNETIKFIYEGFKGQEGRWPSYVNDNLLKRLHGFELMMAPYTIAHLKLGMTLKETGVEELNNRLGVYLTNTLEEGVPQQPDLFSFGLAEAVSEESRLAAEVKSEKPVMVVIGNPPYSGESSNKTKYANSLVEKYKVEPGGTQKLQEKNYKWIGDDYVKFIAFAEGMIARQGSGILAMITNNGYLDNPTFRGMRWHLAKTFDKIYVLDLHGSTKKKEVTPDGGKDENVFDIMQGVGIIMAVKNDSKTSELADVYHADAYGKRQSKFDKLNGEVGFEQVSYDKKSMYFVPKNTEGIEEYMEGVAVNELFANHSLGYLTKKDRFITDVNKQSLVERLSRFSQATESDEDIAEGFGLKVADNDKWNIKNALHRIRQDGIKHQLIKRTGYRIFEDRYVYYDPIFVARPNTRVMHNLDVRDNLCIVTTRQLAVDDFAHIFMSEKMTEQCFISTRTKEGGYCMPLYNYHEDGTRTANFDAAELSALTRQLSGESSPEDVLDYIYAVLHSPSYREKYKEFLKIDFPRVPVPAQAEFDRLVPLGRELRELHLMKSNTLNKYETTFPVQGDDIVAEIKWIGQEVSIGSAGNPETKELAYEKDAVYINKTQYFGNVPRTAWEFYIGGYQPAQKWLKDRRGRTLSSEDIDHYQKIIKILLETDKIMKQIG